MARPIPQPARAFLALNRWGMRLKVLPGPESAALAPHAERLLRTMPAFLTGKPDPSVATEDHVVPGRGGDIPVRLHRRPGTPSGAPVLLYVHGGAFVDFGLAVADVLHRQLAVLTGAVVVGLSYRLAPEHPFPAGLEDCEDVLAWLAGRHPGSPVSVWGESAGGNLALALCMTTRDSAGPAVEQLTLIAPFVDTTLVSTDWDTVKLPGASRAGAELMVQAYAGAERDNPLVNVLHGELAGLPRTLVVSSEHDPVRTDCFRLVERLTAAEVRTAHLHFDNLPHGFTGMAGLIKEVPVRVAEVVAAAR